MKVSSEACGKERQTSTRLSTLQVSGPVMLSTISSNTGDVFKFELFFNPNWIRLESNGEYVSWGLLTSIISRNHPGPGSLLSWYKNVFLGSSLSFMPICFRDVNFFHEVKMEKPFQNLNTCFNKHAISR